MQGVGAVGASRTDPPSLTAQVRNEKWAKIGGMAAKSKNIMTGKQNDILKDIPAARQQEAAGLFETALKELDTLRDTVGLQKVRLPRSCLLPPPSSFLPTRRPS